MVKKSQYAPVGFVHKFGKEDSHSYQTGYHPAPQSNEWVQLEARIEELCIYEMSDKFLQNTDKEDFEDLDADEIMARQVKQQGEQKKSKEKVEEIRKKQVD